MKLPKRPKKKFILPIFLIFFLIFVSLWGWAQKSNINFDFELFKKQKIVSPLPSLTPKENLENLLKTQGLVPLSLDFREKEVQASFSGSLTTLFSLEKDLSSQVISLQFILSRSKIEGRLPKLVDLRFRKPVISY